jgi:hypothetical protein
VHVQKLVIPRFTRLPDASGGMMIQRLILPAAIDDGFDAMMGDEIKRFSRRQTTNIKLEHRC